MLFSTLKLGLEIGHKNILTKRKIWRLNFIACSRAIFAEVVDVARGKYDKSKESYLF